ncbi:MAG: aspartate--tRNA ligase [Acidobacteriota bacterium]
MSPQSLPNGSPLMGTLRTAWCGELRSDHVDTTVALCGWVDRRRDLGGLVFVDLRDRSGLAQVVVEPENAEVMEATREVRAEFAVRVVGRIVAREKPNADLPTGQVEIRAESFEVLSSSKVPPFVVADDAPASEELRLKYRYLDLRRPSMQEMLTLRSRAVMAGRVALADAGLLEVETPILFKSTPEGARDYLVPSRVNNGNFYALPQSPQVLKQVLMISGCDGYFQIARCFRDEDLRANRQPEFTQMDLEISFCKEEDVFRVAERFVQAVWAAGGHEVTPPFQEMTWEEAMEKYGSDKPDLRFGMELQDLTEQLAGVGFGVLGEAKSRGDVIKAIRVEGGARFSRKQVDAFTDKAKAAGAGGLLWIKCAEDGSYSGPPVKHLEEDQLSGLAETLGAAAGDLLLMVVGPKKKARTALGTLRVHLGDELDLRPKDRFVFTWIREFPLFEEDEKTGALAAAHHPFCMPHPDDVELMKTDPAKVRALSYDLACNGEELGSGSIRIHRQDIQAQVFDGLGLTREQAQQKFGFFLEALEHGAPPHAGIALGLDRLIMLIAGRDNLRDVIAFPKTASATDLMAECPSEVTTEQLDELGIAVKKQG